LISRNAPKLWTNTLTAGWVSLSDAIVNAGGFLGLAKHDVAVSVSKFKLVDGKLVLPGATEEALKASPEFEYAK
jgi:hypothetical protein